MTNSWKLFPLQRKREWELELARGRLGTLQRSCEQAAGILRRLEDDRADEGAAALAAARRNADPVAHAHALSYLASMDARLARARAHRKQMEAEVAVAREACKRCGQSLEIVVHLHDQHVARLAYAAQRGEARDADYAWIARAAGGEAR